MKRLAFAIVGTAAMTLAALALFAAARTYEILGDHESAQRLRRDTGLDFTAEDVIMTVGSSGELRSAFGQDREGFEAEGEVARDGGLGGDHRADAPAAPR